MKNSNYLSGWLCLCAHWWIKLTRRLSAVINDICINSETLTPDVEWNDKASIIGLSKTYLFSPRFLLLLFLSLISFHPTLPPWQVLKGCKTLCLSVCSMGRIPGGYVTNHVYTWVDPQGRSISPPPDLLEQHTVSGRHFSSQRRGHAPQQGAERRVSEWLTACFGLSFICFCKGVDKQLEWLNGENKLCLTIKN